MNMYRTEGRIIQSTRRQNNRKSYSLCPRGIGIFILKEENPPKKGGLGWKIELL